MLVKFQINGDPVEVNLKSGDRLLVDVLREDRGIDAGRARLRRLQARDGSGIFLSRAAEGVAARSRRKA
jgi:hypothetical protein